jgi:hypothetical protein
MTKVFGQRWPEVGGVRCWIVQDDFWHHRPQFDALWWSGFQLLTLFPSLRSGYPCRGLITEHVPIDLNPWGHYPESWHHLAAWLGRSN